MAKSRLEKLRVSSWGSLRYIEVPVRDAVAVHSYLLRNGISASHPAPCYFGVDTIEIPRGPETKAIQILLDRWT
jgi:hypothetical protein